MARLLFRPQPLPKIATFFAPISLSHCNSLPRAFSSRSRRAELVEIDLESSSSSSSDGGGGGGGEVELMGMKKLEDAIYSIIVRRSAPDWLPFMPGRSYWVPPKPRAESIVEVVGKLGSALTEEESLSLTSLRGWPCSSFLFEDDMPSQPASMEVEVQVHVRNKSKKAPPSEDEE